MTGDTTSAELTYFVSLTRQTGSACSSPRVGDLKNGLYFQSMELGRVLWLL
jgi:hypothetical protein